MNNETGCVYIDGPHLFADIERVWRQHPELAKKPADIEQLSHSMISYLSRNFSNCLRVVYYIKKSDARLKTHLLIPDRHNIAGHWQIKECGISLKNKTIPTIHLDKLPKQYQDVFPRAEKGIDMELGCDALLLAAGGRVSCFTFMINDRDYMPLLSAIQRLGCNTYLVSLDKNIGVQKDLTNLADRYVTIEQDLYKIFRHQPE